MPSEAFGRARDRSALPGSTPSMVANRSHSRPLADPRGAVRREQFVREDRGFPRRPRLAGQDLPLTGPGPRRVGGQPPDPAQVLAGPEMILRVVPGQHDALGGKLGAVAPHDLLDKGRAGLWLADMQEDLGLSGGV